MRACVVVDDNGIDFCFHVRGESAMDYIERAHTRAIEPISGRCENGSWG